MKRTFLGLLFVAVLFPVVILGWLSSSVEHKRQLVEEKTIRIDTGENAYEVASRLEDIGVVGSRFVFLYALARTHGFGKLVAGEYLFSGSVNALDIARSITQGATVSRDIQVTFPEGFTVKKMASRLAQKGLPGVEFERLAYEGKARFVERHQFLKDIPVGASLEGFLFPDTYRFAPDASAESILDIFLSNFEKKALPVVEQKRGSRSLYDVVILSSIVEAEVQTERDRKMVADLFLRRLAQGHLLQSDATLAYALGTEKIQHSIEETRNRSPYNTYVHLGLPPGPIGNPGLVSLSAVLAPEKNTYFYFLSNPKTGETFFSTTFEEHVGKKSENGL